ncbi:MAG: response regulator [Gemmatimonadaceae bacterium]
MSVHVLIVEDSVLVTDALRTLLEATDHRVTTASGVAAAVASIERDPPDVMLLDLGLRDGNGLLVLERLAAASVTCPATIAVTGSDAPEIREACRAAGCVDVLLKPVPSAILRARIAAAAPGRG